MRSKRIAVGLAVAVTWMGCSDHPVTEPQSRLTATTPSLDRNEGNGVVQGIGGKALYLEPQQRVPESYQFNAVKHRDGSVEGEVRFVLENNGGITVVGKILCFGTIGNRANVAMRTIASNTPDAPRGQLFVWSFVDNGYFTDGDKDHDNGRGQPPDQTSGFESVPNETVAQAHCATPMGVGAFAPVRGDLDIKDYSKH